MPIARASDRRGRALIANRACGAATHGLRARSRLPPVGRADVGSH